MDPITGIWMSKTDTNTTQGHAYFLKIITSIGFQIFVKCDHSPELNWDKIVFSIAHDLPVCQTLGVKLIQNNPKTICQY